MSSSENPRILLAAPQSGTGKTMLTCGLLRAMQRRNIPCVSFKCGPDYIDPMFHRTVLGIAGSNLDTFFAEKDMVRAIVAKAEGKLAVIEGVMGYYDGLGGTELRASTYEVAKVTDTPVILIVDGKKCSLSAAALVYGFLTYQKDSHIRGVICNRMNPMLYQRLAPKLEELGVKALGCVPEFSDICLESRHLGLVMPQEIPRWQERLERLAEKLEQYVDLDGILQMAESAASLSLEQTGTTGSENKDRKKEREEKTEKEQGKEEAKEDRKEEIEDRKKHRKENKTEDGTRYNGTRENQTDRPKIAVAMDEAFCFYYPENLDCLREAGAELVFFSPLYDAHLPERTDGLLLGGGYPELFAKELSENVAMREEIREAVCGGLPVLAECGGFLYLHQELEDEQGQAFPMVGVFEEKGFKKDKLGRFGYITLTSKTDGLLGAGEQIRAHEFHYWESTQPGCAMQAKKPTGARSWECMIAGERMLAGFPHLYYPSNPEFSKRFVTVCREYRKEYKKENTCTG